MKNGDMTMGDIIAAIEYNIAQAKKAWYLSEPPYLEAKPYMEIISSIAADAASKCDDGN